MGDLPSDFGEGSTNQSPAGQWKPSPTSPTPPGSRTWPAVALAAIALVVAIAALVVALTHSANTAPPTTTVPTHTAAETAAAQRELCDSYTLAAREVQVETNGSDKALARIALTNAAAMLDDAAADPALDVTHRDAARALATAFRATTALSSGGTDAQWRASLDDGNAKDAVMKKVCGGG